MRNARDKRFYTVKKSNVGQKHTLSKPSNSDVFDITEILLNETVATGSDHTYANPSNLDERNANSVHKSRENNGA